MGKNVTFDKNRGAISAPVFNAFFDPEFDIIDASDKSINNNLSNLYKSKTWKSVHIDDKEFDLHILSVKKSNVKKRTKDEKLVYEIIQKGDSYNIRTGRYIGIVHTKEGVFKTPSKYLNVDINTGYSRLFLNRMLNFASGISFDSHSRLDRVKETNSEDFFSYIVGYLFLISLQHALVKGLPMSYRKVKEHGLNVKGKISINDYISHDMVYGYKLTYSYNKLDYVQDIVDVLYSAMYSLVASDKIPQLINEGDYRKFYLYLKQMYSGKKPSRLKIKQILSNKALRNPIHADYKNALMFAQYILEHKNITYDEGNTKGCAYLIDVTELWELYLCGLLRSKFVNGEWGYKLKWQYDYLIYKDKFWGRYNYPDIVMESNDSIVVFDAKFKTMNFKYEDVDRSDLHQIQSYAGYFLLNKEINKRLKLCSLVYPTHERTEEKQSKEPVDCNANLYGLDGEDIPKFSIGFIQIPEKDDIHELKKQEEAFLDRVGDLLREE